MLLNMLYHSITHEEFYPWQTLVPTPMVLNSSSPMPNIPISIPNILCSASKLDGCVSFMRRDHSWLALFRVIDGADSTLDAIEKIPVDDKHRPIQEVRIRSVTIHANPIADKARWADMTVHWRFTLDSIRPSIWLHFDSIVDHPCIFSFHLHKQHLY